MASDKMSNNDEMSGSREEEDSARGPYKFTPEKVKAICDRIRKGSFLRHACERERVTERGLYHAMARDPEVAADVHEAQAESEENLLARMEVNTFDWKREAWLLERKRRDLFKPPKAEAEVKQELTGKDGAPLIPRVQRSPAEIAAELARLQTIAAETAADLDEIRQRKGE